MMGVSVWVIDLPRLSDPGSGIEGIPVKELEGVEEDIRAGEQPG